VYTGIHDRTYTKFHLAQSSTSPRLLECNLVHKLRSACILFFALHFKYKFHTLHAVVITYTNSVVLACSTLTH